MGMTLFSWDGSIGSFSDETEAVKDPIGATLKIQQKIRLDEEEQRLIQAQMARFRAAPPAAARPQVRRQQQPPQCKNYFSNFHVENIHLVVPSREAIQSLVAMGFPEDRAKSALINTRGDISRAAEILVQNL